MNSWSFTPAAFAASTAAFIPAGSWAPPTDTTRLKTRTPSSHNSERAAVAKATRIAVSRALARSRTSRMSE